MHVGPELLARWSALLPSADPAAADGAGRDLLARWSQPHRAYHDTAHLTAVLDAVDLLAAESDVDTGDLDAVRLAAWFHDAVHEGVPGADEEASARLALGVLPGLGVSPERADEVARLVLLTATHAAAPGDAAGELLCDADLSVLGAAPEAYGRYATAVRAEYAHVPDAAFAAGRAAVLRQLLGLEPLYRTRGGRRRWAESARRNLTAELARLEGASPSG